MAPLRSPPLSWRRSHSRIPMLFYKSLPLLLLSLLLSTSPAMAQSIEEIVQQGLEAYRAGDYAAAVVAWQQMIELDPDFQAAQDNLALIEAAIAESEAAE